MRTSRITFSVAASLLLLKTWILFVSGVFFLIQAYAFIKYLQAHMTRSEFKHLFNLAIIGFAGLVFLAVVGLTYLGKSPVLELLVFSLRFSSQ